MSLGKQTDAVYTDYSSVFSSISHILLLHEMEHSFGVTGVALDCLKSYLGDRTQRVVLGGKHSGWAAVRSRVPEGSILGSILFACFVADIPHSIKANCLLFGDDVKLFNRIDCQQDRQQLPNDLDRLSI